MRTLGQGTLHVAADAAGMSAQLAAFIVEHARSASDGAIIALSGGSTPQTAYRLLATAPHRDRMPWATLHWVMGDERLVDPRDPASNFGMVCDTFLSHVPAPADRVHGVPTDLPADDAAAAYEHTLRTIYGAETLDPARPLFDLVLLGLGEDGHVASLIPGQPAVHEMRRWVVGVPHGRSEPRVSLTIPAIDSSRAIVIIAAGPAKRPIVDAVLSGRAGEPTALLRPQGAVHWFMDRAAAGDHG